MKRLVYLSIATVLLVGLLPVATVAQAGGLSLTPESQQGSTTCRDAEAFYALELLNETGVDSFFDITVSSVFPTTCPAQVYAAEGQMVSFECQVGVPFGGEADTATITAGGQGYTDSATVTTVVDRTGEWTAETPSPFATQSSPIISWDGKLYVLGLDDDDRGVPPDGQVLIWDGTAWTLGAASGQYGTVDKDACLGLDAGGNPVIDLLSGQPGPTTLLRYDISADAWTTIPLPSGYPAGLNDAQIVSMIQHTGQNLCYVAGGWSYSGTPYPSPLYAYDPAAGTFTSLGSFTYAPADLMDHFAWYVPWVGGGAVCIAGGRYRYDVGLAYADSQCYVLSSGTFDAVNADLGPLPEEWREGGDAWRELNGQYQIWGVGGSDSDFELLGSFYAAPGQGFGYGPEQAHEFYAVEADNYDGAIWAANGSTQGFWSSTLVESLHDCPESCIAPAGASFDWSPPAPTILDDVTFAGAVAGGTGPRTYGWDFGDGATAIGRTAHHTFAAPGDYTVTLTVSNECSSTQAQETVTVIGVPDILLSPASLEQTLEPETQADQTLSVCNEGTQPLTWSLGEAEGTKALTPPLTQGERETKVFTHTLSPGERAAMVELPHPLSGKIPQATGAAGRAVHPDAVLWEQVPDGSFYMYSDYWPDYSGLAFFSADDFQNAEPWAIDTIHLYGFHEAGSVANAAALHWCLYADAGGVPAGDPFAGGQTWCWSTVPSDPAVTIGGANGADVTLNVVAGQGTPLLVPPGQWWLLFYPEFAGFADVWAVQLIQTTNLADAAFLDPLDYFGMGMTAWTPMSAFGAGDLDMAFRLEGIAQTFDIPWLSESPTAGSVLPGECAEVTATFSSTGLDVGTYTGALDVYSNDPDTPLATVPVQLTVELPGPKISVSPTSLTSEQCPDTQTTQSLDICSIGSEDLTWSLSEAIDWLSADLLGGTLVPGDCDQVAVTLNSAGLLPDSFFDVFTVDSNDVHHPQVQVSAQMTVWALPGEVGFTWVPPIPVVGEVVTFSGTAQGGGTLVYTWDWGDGGGGGGAIVEHTFAAAGEYVVTLTVSNECSQASLQQTVTVVAPDIAVSPASLSAALCPEAEAGQTLQVCNLGGASLIWSLSEALDWLAAGPAGGTILPGDPCTDVMVAFDAAGLASGTYTGDLLVDSNDPDTPQVTVPVELTVLEAVHDADFAWTPVAPYAGQRVTFTGTAQGSEPIRYTWGFDPGIRTLPEANPVTYRFTAPGDYLVSMGAWNACGGQFVHHTVAVAPTPSKTHVNWIRMSYVDRGLGRYAVVGKVQIVDAGRAAVPGATVHAEWTAPNGATTAQQVATNLTGVAAFKMSTTQTGTWQICVTDVVLAGWVYDPAANVETCDTITIP